MNSCTLYPLTNIAQKDISTEYRNNDTNRNKIEEIPEEIEGEYNKPSFISNSNEKKVDDVEGGQSYYKTQDIEKDRLQQVSHTRIEISEQSSQKNLNIIFMPNKYQTESVSSIDFKNDVNNCKIKIENKSSSK